MHLVAQPEALPFELQNHIERTRGRELPFPLRQHFVEKPVRAGAGFPVLRPEAFSPLLAG